MCVYTDRNNIVSKLLRVVFVFVFSVLGSKDVGAAAIDFDIFGADSFIALVSDTTDAICVVDVDFVVSCFAAFDTVNEGDDFIFTFVALVIAVI